MCQQMPCLAGESSTMWKLASMSVCKKNQCHLYTMCTHYCIAVCSFTHVCNVYSLFES